MNAAPMRSHANIVAATKNGKSASNCYERRWARPVRLRNSVFFLKELAESDHLPDYTVELTEADQVIFRNRETWWKTEDDEDALPRPVLSTDAYERAKKYTGRENFYAWEQDWIQFWRDSGCPTLKSADAAFIGFCKSHFVRLGWKA